jgi:hypothetical protein
MLHPLRMKQEKNCVLLQNAPAFFDIDKKRTWITRCGRMGRPENTGNFPPSVRDRQPSFREPPLQKKYILS